MPFFSVKYIVSGIFCLFIFIFLVFTIYLSVVSYENFLDFIFNFFSIPDDKKQVISSNYFTQSKYRTLIFINWSLLLILTTGSLLIINKLLIIKNKYASIHKDLLEEIKNIKTVYCNLSKKQKSLFYSIILFLLLIRIFYWHQLPFLYDEVYSWLFFVKKGFFTTLVYYPGPNNHIFHNLICTFLHKAGLPPQFAMKIPALFFSIITGLLIFIYFKKKWGFYGGIVVMIAFSFHPVVMYYSIQGRGYMLQILFFVIGLIVYERIVIKNRETGYNRMLFILSAILGCWAVPTHIYAVLSFFFTGSFIRIFTNKNIRLFQWIFNYIIIGAGIFILYLPVFTITGISNITASGWFKNMPFNVWLKNFFSWFNDVSGYLSGFELNISITAGLAFIFFLFVIIKGSKNQLNFYSNIFFLIIPFLVIPLQGYLPWPRIWSYMVIPFIFLLYTGLNKLANVEISNILILFVAIGWLSFSIYNMNQEFGNKGKYGRIKDFYEKLSVYNPEKVLVEDDFYYVYNKYYSTINEKEIKFVPGDLKKNANFDFIILDNKNEKIPAGYKEIYKNKEIQLAKRIN